MTADTAAFSSLTIYGLSDLSFISTLPDNIRKRIYSIIEILIIILNGSVELYSPNNIIKTINIIINTTATMCLTGDNMVSNSRIHAIGDNAGKTNYAKDLFINIKDVTIKNGTATVYVAMYSQPLKNVYLQAVLKNGADGADGDVYDFNISNDAKTAITLAPGKVYPIKRKGVKQEIPATLADLNGEGTEDAPYQIGSMADLKCMANDLKVEADCEGKYF